MFCHSPDKRLTNCDRWEVFVLDRFQPLVILREKRLSQGAHNCHSAFFKTIILEVCFLYMMLLGQRTPSVFNTIVLHLQLANNYFFWYSVHSLGQYRVSEICLGYHEDRDHCTNDLETIPLFQISVCDWNLIQILFGCSACFQKVLLLVQWEHANYTT